jgi:N-glycosylase/DNA lyase
VRKSEFSVRDYNLAATLTSGQAFRWRLMGNAWEGVISGRWVRLHQRDSIIEATTAESQSDWQWLTDYLRLDNDHAAAVASFPDDNPMRAAAAHCHGLRLLCQEPWECLASFILSSTKQIVQIQQCVALLCERYGESVAALRSAGLRPGVVPTEESNAPGRRPALQNYSFPEPTRIAAASEAELRECKMGFRAKYLLDAARRVSSGRLDLAALPALSLTEAREALMECHGVGRKIADCVLLFSLGFDEAFPIDVWVERALQQLYFPKRRVKRVRLEQFATTHFGPHAGLAQQYLFHYLRTGDARSRRGNEAELRGKRQTSASSRRRLRPKTKS